MKTRTLVAGGVAGAVVMLGGTALVSGGIASGAQHAGLSAAQQEAAASALGKHAGARGAALLRRLEHGELTVRTKKGNQAYDVQRGVVGLVSPTSLAVTSVDGFKATYTIDAGTKVRRHGSQIAIGDVQSGDHVFVVATGGTAVRVVELPAKASATPGSSSG